MRGFLAIVALGVGGWLVLELNRERSSLKRTLRRLEARAKEERDGFFRREETPVEIVPPVSGPPAAPEARTLPAEPRSEEEAVEGIARALLKIMAFEQSGGRLGIEGFRMQAWNEVTKEGRNGCLLMVEFTLVAKTDGAWAHWPGVGEPATLKFTPVKEKVRWPLLGGPQFDGPNRSVLLEQGSRVEIEARMELKEVGPKLWEIVRIVPDRIRWIRAP